MISNAVKTWCLALLNFNELGKTPCHGDRHIYCRTRVLKVALWTVAGGKAIIILDSIQCKYKVNLVVLAHQGKQEPP